MAVVAVFRLATRGDVVVAKTDPPMLSIALLLPATLRGALLINWLQDLFPEVLQELARRKVPRFLYEVLKGLRDASLRRAAANVAIGTQMKALLERQRVPLETIRVIPNWADARAILPVPPSDNVLRREWGLGDAVIIGYSGNLGRVHELEIILKAAQRTLHDNRLMFVFIGSGYQRPRLEALKAEWSLTNVIFKDPVPRRHLGSSLTLPDVHLVSLKPALEGLVVPSKIYGVMAAGLPCIFIGSPEGEVGRLLSMAPAAGLSIAPGNDEHLASALLELAANQSLRRAMGAAARQRFLANFDVEIAVDSWYELIRDTVKRH
jgi:glycosyltransferase involved in cell wall biosynthesis